jgi:hypothetical protein
VFEYARKEPLSFLKITPSYDTPDNKKFSKNWLHFLDPNKDFGDNKFNQIEESEDDEEEESDDEYQPIIVAKRKYTKK